MRVAIIGAGIIGASTAWHLAQRGIDAIVIEAGSVAGQASGRGFGWINASFHLDETHYHLRIAAMDSWRRLPDHLSTAAINWSGALCLEEQGAALENRYETLKNLGYQVEILKKSEISALEPALADPPESCLRFGAEGAVDLTAMARAMLRDAQARIISGTRVAAIETKANRVVGLRLETGHLAVDAVVIAAGIGSAALVAPLDVALPMLPRPGLMIRTRPLPPMIRHVLICPDQELRQDATGRILAPTAANHQSDASEVVEDCPDVLADRVIARLRRMFPGVALDWEEVSLAMRPVPGDGRPVIGPAGPEGLYLAVMHSGATLGALAGALAAGEVAGQEAEILAPYRPARFVQD